LTTIYSFCPQIGCPDGNGPQSGLIQASNGAFYGTTFRGGAYDEGTIFSITPAGKLTVLHSFQLTDGAFPTTALMQATNGNFYGTTQRYAANNGGTFFEMTPSGKLTTLYNFCAETNCRDGGSPWEVIQATDGNFYGATNYGGATGHGTLFEITPAGKLTTLYSFCPASPCTGDTPDAGLLQATDGGFYGTTFIGGTRNAGTVFRLSTGLGPFVKTQPSSGKVGTRVAVLGTDLTGTTEITYNGKAANFTVVSAAEITTTVPLGATTGRLAVTTPGSGIIKSNLVFKVLPQINIFTPASGPTGTNVVITGVSLTQTTNVTIGGKAASFTVNSDTQLTAIVPSGASTGKIRITTLGGTVTSATSFTLTTAMIGDRNGDSVVNCTDLDIVKASFGKSIGQTGFDPRADVNGDGLVNIIDLAAVASALPAGTTCPQSKSLLDSS
jgi:uncharacterized repeat protein (TIGR03803 family)